MGQIANREKMNINKNGGGGEHIVALIAVSNVPFTLMKFLRTGFLLMVNPCKIHIFLSRKKKRNKKGTCKIDKTLILTLFPKT
jgi:hypothetical protein